jgi:hypothetical protein
VAGCGFHGPDVIPDGGGEPGGPITEKRTFFAADLLAGQVTDMTVDTTRAALTPNAYTYGGLIGHGLKGTRLWQHNDSAWTKLDGKTATGAGLWTGEELKNTGTQLLPGYLGVVNDSTMTLWLEGEVWLDAASNETFQVSGDDIGFVELASPGTTTFTRIAENATVPVAVPVSGWYPIRVGFANGDTPFDFIFMHSDTAGTAVPWTRDRMRARASQMTGMLRTAFAHQIFGGGQGTMSPLAHFDEGDLLAQTGFSSSTSPLPQGVGNDDWSARYSGQIYIDQQGTYALVVTGRDGLRSRLGAMHGESNWIRDSNSSADGTASVTASLVPGWNDIGVDYNQVKDSRSLRVRWGPDLVNVSEVPRDRLRPVQPMDDLLASGVDETNRNPPNGGGVNSPATATMMVPGYLNETVDFIELTYQANSGRWGSLRVDLETPGGTRVNLDDPGNLQNGDRFVQVTIPTTAAGALATLLGGASGGAWKLHMYDVNAGGGGGTVFESARITLHTHGGPDRVARAATWISAPIDATTNIIAMDGITWIERLPIAGTIKVSYRLCAQATCGDDPKWSETVGNGAKANIGDPQRYLQLKVELTSDGMVEPELRALVVNYKRSAS